MCICLSMSISVFICLLMSTYVYPCISMSHIHLFFNTSRHLSICAFIHPSIYLSITYPPIYFNNLHLKQSSYLPIDLYILSYLPKTHVSVMRMYP